MMPGDERDPVVSAILDRIHLLAGIPRNHGEDFQVTKCELCGCGWNVARASALIASRAPLLA